MNSQPATAKTAEIASQPAKTARSAAICPNCGNSFVPASYQQTFCSKEHKTAFHARQADEGRAIVALAKAWRAARNAKGSSAEAQALRQIGADALSEMSAILDLFNSQDREAGRPNPLGYAKGLLAQGKFIDRKRG